MAQGDVGVLRRMYPTMKKYVNACRFWCGFGFGKHRYLWEMPGTLGFGDWVAPDVPQMSQWQGRIKWTGTASLCNTSALLAKIADILGETQDAKHYRALSEKTADAYCSILTDGNGKLLEEFQTAYVLPIYLNMFPTQQIREKAAANLAALAKRNDWCIARLPRHAVHPLRAVRQRAGGCRIPYAAEHEMPLVALRSQGRRDDDLGTLGRLGRERRLPDW